MGNFCGLNDTIQQDEKLKDLDPEYGVIQIGSSESKVENFGMVVSDFFTLNEDQKAAIAKYGLHQPVVDSHAPIRQAKTEKTRHEGQFFNGKRQGIGHYMDESGNLVVGKFQDDHLKVDSAVYFTNGDFMKISSLADKNRKMSNFSGYCSLWYRNGGRYEGNYLNGKKHGQGKMTWIDGSFYQGAWKEGVQDGEGVFTDASGTVSQGKFVNGRKTK